MDQWTRRDLLKAGILAPAGVASLQWADGTTDRNLALNRAAWASSSVDFIRTGHMATDGQNITHWCSADTDLQWIYVDLGATCKIHSIVLRWGSNYATAYKLQFSRDREASAETGLVENWVDINATTIGKGGAEQITVPEVRAKYVRLLCSRKMNSGGYELSALEVHGAGGLEALPVPPPAPEADGTLRLTGGWKLREQGRVQEDAAIVSRRGYNDRDWLIATVPGTVLTSYLNLGAVPDLFYGDHQLQVSDFFAHTNWWYRNELSVPANFRGKRIWLNFQGINHRAEIYVNGKSVGKMAGAFVRGCFDVSDCMVAGRKNCIAVLVMPVPKPDKVNVKDLNGYTWPNDYPKNEPTILAAASWDWLPTIRDRDMGIWNHVTLRPTGDVTLAKIFASPHFPDPQDLTRVNLTIKLELENHSAKACSGELHVRFGDAEFTHPVVLEGREVRALARDQSTHPELALLHPRLWWPSGYGEQNLYDLTLHFRHGAEISDEKICRVGIREYTYNHAPLTQWDTSTLKNAVDKSGIVIKDPLTIFCNGQRIFIRGVNWGMEEGMLRCDREGFKSKLRMEKEMNFNLIRNWGGNLDKPEFFELCDEYGLMVWEEFGMAQQISPDDPQMWLANAKDRFLRRRNHACVVVWCAANESIPTEPIRSEMPKLAEALDGTRLFLQGSTQIPPTNGDGPYTTKPPSFYFNGFARGFRPEMGAPAIPAVESMRRMMPQNKLWPVNDLWGMHDWWLGKRWGGAGICGPTQTAIDAYGKPEGIEDFCRKAQMVNMQVFKAIYEAWNDRMWNDCTGVMLWMSNPAWPSLTWNTYDYYMEPTAAYFACRVACEPVHIQWNAVSNSVKIINATLKNLQALNAVVEIYDLDGKLFQTKSIQLDCPANQARECMQLFVSGMDTIENLSDVHFIKLVLKDNEGKVLSRNFYWRSKSEWKYEELQGMKQVRLTGAVGGFKDGHITVDLKNPNSEIALMARLKLIDRTTGLLVAPVIYSDNYFSFAPHESRRIDIHIDAHSRDRPVDLILEGWNIAPLELARDLFSA